MDHFLADIERIDMNTTQPEALRLADELCEAIAEYPEPTALEAQAAAELRRQHARITELESQLAQRFDAAAHGPTSGAADLPEALRVPLDSLHADAGYLCGRLLNGSLTQEQVVESIRRRIDAAKLAALTAQAISAEPAEHVQNPAENEHVAGDVSGNGAGLNMSTPHARITELESQLAQRFDAADVATAAAQGFRDGVASVSAGSEPEAWREHVEQRLLAWRQSFVNRSGDQLALDDFMDEQSLDDLIDFVCDEWALNTHPSPPEGMAGWKPIETAPKNGTEILGYTEEAGALVLYWDSMTGEMDHWSDGMSVSFWKPTHWMPLPAAPGPADGESNG